MCNDHGHTVAERPCCDRATYVSGPRPTPGPTPTATPVVTLTAAQRELAAIERALRTLAASLGDQPMRQLDAIADRLHVQLERDIAAVTYSDAALDRAVAFYREHRMRATVAPRDLLDGMLAAARGL